MSSAFLDKVRKVTKQFFALPMKEKEKYARPADDIEGYGNDPILSDKQVLDWSDRLLLHLTPEDSRKLQLWPTNPNEFRYLYSPIRMVTSKYNLSLLSNYSIYNYVYDTYIL